MDRKRRKRDAKRLVEAFNETVPLGSSVRYWRGPRASTPSGEGKTRSEAFLTYSGDAVVFVEGCSGYVALTHVEPIRA